MENVKKLKIAKLWQLTQNKVINCKIFEVV